MGSVFLGCQINDDIADSLKLLRGELAEYQRQHAEALAAIKPTIDRILSGTDTHASKIIGVTDTDQVEWTAKLAGRAGNAITVTYSYLGADVDDSVSPPVFIPRPTSASASGNYVTVILAVDSNGVIDTSVNVATALPIWLSGPGVTDLVGGTLVGDGSGIANPVGPTLLEGGSKATMKNTETAANEVSKIFGKGNYTSLLESIDIPVIQNPEDARKYLNDTDDRYITINGKLLIVEGDNLVGINKMYGVVEKNLTELRNILALMQEDVNAPFFLITQNVEKTRVEYICGNPEQFTTVETTYRGYNQNVWTVANTYAKGNGNALNLYLLWSVGPAATQNNYRYLRVWGIPDNYRGDILVGTTPEQGEGDIYVPAPEVLSVTDPALLDKLNFTDDEVVQLLDAQIDGVSIPQDIPILDRVVAVQNLSRVNSNSLPTGLTTGVDKEIAAAQAINLGDTLDDDGLTKELATRGSGCARQDKNFADELIPSPNFDAINIPSPDLPDAAKQVESAFGALSSAVNVANKVFDLQWNATVGLFGPLLNKIQNVNSLADNVFGANKLADCLLGTGGGPVGLPEAPELGSGQSPGISIPDVTGGLPIPTSLLKDALGELSVDLDESLTSSIETVMGLIRTPMCIVQTMMSALNGIKPPTLGGVLDALNPCKDGKDSEDNCPPEAVQDIINASETLTQALDSIPRLDDLPTEAITEEVNESVQHFTGFVEKTTEEVQNEIERGVKQVMNDIQSSLDAKLEQVEKLREAINKLFGETSDQAENAEENQKESSGCGSTTAGAFTDAIEGFIGT